MCIAGYSIKFGVKDTTIDITTTDAVRPSHSLSVTKLQDCPPLHIVFPSFPQPSSFPPLMHYAFQDIYPRPRRGPEGSTRATLWVSLSVCLSVWTLKSKNYCSIDLIFYTRSIISVPRSSSKMIRIVIPIWTQ